MKLLAYRGRDLPRSAESMDATGSGINIYGDWAPQSYTGCCLSDSTSNGNAPIMDSLAWMLPTHRSIRVVVGFYTAAGPPAVYGTWAVCEGHSSRYYHLHHHTGLLCITCNVYASMAARNKSEHATIIYRCSCRRSKGAALTLSWGVIAGSQGMHGSRFYLNVLRDI